MKGKRVPKKSLTTGLRKKMVFPSDSKYLAQIRQIIDGLWTKQGLPKKDSRLVALAVDEAISSIIRHAQGMKRPGNINIELHLDEVCFKVIIKDNTNGFDFNLLTERDKKIILEREKQYQLGVFLISAIMDEISYYYKKGFQNELQLTKFIIPKKK